MRRLLVVVLVLLVGSAHAGAPVGAVAPIDRVIARVGSIVIWDSEVDERMRHYGDTDREKMIATLIDEALFLARAYERRIAVDDKDVDAALAEIKQSRNLDDAALEQVLNKQGMTLARFRQDLARQLLVMRAKVMELGDTKLAGTFDEQVAAYLAVLRRRIHIQRWP